MLKIDYYPNLQSVTEAIYKFQSKSKIFPYYIILKKVDMDPAMQKKFEHEKTTIEVDNISGEYYTVIPEWVIHDMDWYEGCKVNFNIESDEVIITDSTDED